MQRSKLKLLTQYALPGNYIYRGEIWVYRAATLDNYVGIIILDASNAYNSLS